MSADIFDLTFEILQSSLISGRISYNNDNNNDTSNNKEQENNLNDRLDVAISLEIKKSSNDRINKIKFLRKQLLINAKNNILKYEPIDMAIKASYEKSKELCQRQQNISKRRIEQHVDISERRMRELVFEIIGEYGKSNIRITRRQQIVKFISRLKVLCSVWQVRWDRFCLRLCYESSRDLDNSSTNNGIKYQLLCPESNKEEIKSIELKLRKKLGQAFSATTRVNCIIKFNKKTKTQIIPGKATNENIVIATTETEILNFSDVLRAWITTSTRPSSVQSGRGDGSTLGSARINSSNVKLRDFLQSSLVAWLHPGSFYPSHWDKITLDYRNNLIQYDDVSVLEAFKDFEGLADFKANQNLKVSDLDQFVLSYASQFSCVLAGERIFFSLEERLLSMDSNAGNNIAKSEINDADALMESLSALQSLYARKNLQTVASNVDAVRRTLNSDPLRKLEVLGHHRTKRYSNLDKNTQDILRSFPDVVKATVSNVGDMHFAPASILHLAEVKEFQKIINSDEIRTAAVTCPHPNLTQICSSKNGGNLLDRLYCLVRVVPPRLSSMLPNQESKSNEKKEADKMENSEVMESFQYMIPLSDLCMRELIKAHLFPKVVTKSSTSASASSIIEPSFIHLLPDHARVRNTYAEPGQLYHKYVLLEDLNSNSAFGSPQLQKMPIPQPCYYLIQIADSSNDSKTVSRGKNLERHDLHDNILNKLVISTRNESKLGLKNAKMKPLESELDLTFNEQAYAEEDTSRPNKWDPAVLSTLCRWRACLCEASKESPSKYLCKYHAQLGHFLDEKSQALAKGGKNVTSESAKYLPKRAPNLSTITSEVKKDLVLIRAASTLLQELWDGKLHATVKSFLKKTISDLGIRRRLELALANSTPKVANQKNARKNAALSITLPTKPEWMIWKDDDYKETAFDVMNENESIMNNIHAVETMINEELRAMLDFKIYPTAEIAMIRKDIKAFKDFQEEQQSNFAQSQDEKNIITTYKVLATTLRNELKVCDKKLSVFRARRVDEVSTREVLARKKARKQKEEEAERNDPANFGFRR